MSTQERSAQRSNHNKPETSRTSSRKNTNEDERIDPSYKRAKENKTPTDSKTARPTPNTHNATTVNR